MDRLTKEQGRHYVGDMSKVMWNIKKKRWFVVDVI